MVIAILLFVWAGFCFAHALRDYLQLRGVKTWFTEVLHHVSWFPVFDERVVMGTFLVLGAASLSIAISII